MQTGLVVNQVNRTFWRGILATPQQPQVPADSAH